MRNDNNTDDNGTGDSEWVLTDEPATAEGTGPGTAAGVNPSAEQFDAQERERYGFFPFYNVWSNSWWWQTKPWGLGQLFMHLLADANRTLRANSIFDGVATKESDGMGSDARWGFCGAWEGTTFRHQKAGRPNLSTSPLTPLRRSFSGYPWAGCVPAEPACVSPEKRGSSCNWAADAGCFPFPFPVLPIGGAETETAGASV